MKFAARHLARFIYLGFLALFFIIAVWSDAPAFYYQRPLVKESIIRQEDGSYAYPAVLTYGLFSSRDIQLYQDDRPLTPASMEELLALGQGRYTLGPRQGNRVEIYFSATNNSNPIGNNREYSMRLHFAFATPLVGWLGLLLLAALPWLLALLRSRRLRGDTGSDATQTNRGLPGRLQEAAAQLPFWARRHLYTPENTPQRQPVYRRIFSYTVLAAAIFVLLEWIFLVTKPSFMDLLNWPAKLFIFLSSAMIVILAVLLVLAALVLLDWLADKSRLTDLFLDFLPWPPAVLLAAAFLLTLDNFTYTLFDFGIVTSGGIQRGLYALLFLAACLYFYLEFAKGLYTPTTPGREKSGKLLFYLSAGLVVVALLASASQASSLFQGAGAAATANPEIQEKPNIILMVADGIDASHLSVYGYERQTTPNLDELAAGSLLAENNYTNAGTSTGSDVATLTGKSPLATRVLYPPNILNGVNAYQNLPALLKLIGYKNIQAAVPHYVDAENLNFRDSFDIVNGRQVENQQVNVFLTKYWYPDAAYFLSSLAERLSERLEHIFFQERMRNPYLVVTNEYEPLEDRAKLNDLFTFMDQSEGPVFAHLHFMGTHGAKFAPSRQVFSAGQEQSEDWMTDFYDDAILEFDSYVGEVINYLESSGKMDNTLLVILSDHTQKYFVNRRLPLIMHFPGGENAGRISANTQNMDIAPTILDYLGLEQPQWLDGASLIGDDVDPERYILGARVKNAMNEEDGFFSLESGNLQPPFFQFGHFGMIQCQWWFEMDAKTQNWTWGEIEGHTNPCPGSGEERLEEAKAALQAKLIDNGFLTEE